MNIKSDDRQNFYTADQAHWKDARGTFEIVFYLLSGILFAVLVSIFFASANQSIDQSRQGALYLIYIISSPIVPVVIAIMGLRLFYKNALTYFNALYRPPDVTQSSSLIRRRLFGIPPLPTPLNSMLHYPFVIASQGEIQGHDYTQWLGGPAILVIMDGTALYLDRGNCFSRVVGPGVAFLETYETIKDIVDLRPQTYIGKVEAWTKDGIKVEFIAKIICRIGDPNHAEKHNSPVPVSVEDDGRIAGENTPIFPCDSVNVRKAVEWTKIKKKSTSSGELYPSKWLEGTWGKVQGTLSNYVSKRHLETLFISASHGSAGQILSAEEREQVREKLSRELLEEAGVTLTELQIEKFKIADHIHKKRIEKWAAEWKAKVDVREAHSDAASIRARENSRAEAQRDLIIQIANGLSSAHPDTFNDSVLLALSGLLEQNLGDPYASAYLNEAIDKIKEIIDN